MFKRNYSNKDIEAMKELIIKHEGWVRSDLLPEGWMFKQIAEGITKDNEWYATLHYLSDDGITFDEFISSEFSSKTFNGYWSGTNELRWMKKANIIILLKFLVYSHSLLVRMVI